MEGEGTPPNTPNTAMSLVFSAMSTEDDAGSSSSVEGDVELGRTAESHATVAAHARSSSMPLVSPDTGGNQGGKEGHDGDVERATSLSMVTPTASLPAAGRTRGSLGAAASETHHESDDGGMARPDLPHLQTSLSAREILQAETRGQGGGPNGTTPGAPLETEVVDYTPLTNPVPEDMRCKLRAQTLRRPIRLVILVTCYSESGQLFMDTMSGLAAAVEYLGKESGWSWQDVLVVPIVDGLEKASPSLLQVASEDLGFFTPELVQEKTAGGRPIAMHIFETTAEVPVRSSAGHLKTRRQCLQVSTCLKSRNGGKINSHMWGLRGFCRLLNPTYFMLLDVGTIPAPDSIFLLLDAMEEHPSVGGAAGEILVRVPGEANKCCAPMDCLVDAQRFEYWSSHYLDKASEAFFGYISVLPGAFSLYRWEAVQGRVSDEYFRLERQPLSTLSPFEANIYLAEDRIMAFNILAHKKRAYSLWFVPSSTATTDVPNHMPELVRQRRRWQNGAVFNLAHYLLHVGRHFTSAHSILRKVLFFLLATYNVGFGALAYLAVALHYISFIIIYDSALLYLPAAIDTARFLFSGLYFAMLLTLLLVSLVGNLKEQNQLLQVVAALFGILMLFGVVYGVWLFVLNEVGLLIMAGVFGAFGAFVAVGIVHGNGLRVVSSFAQYLALLPTFTNLLGIYAVCNVHDCTWGTKEGQIVAATRRLLNSQADRLQSRANKLMSAISQLLEFAAEAAPPPQPSPASVSPSLVADEVDVSRASSVLTPSPDSTEQERAASTVHVDAALHAAAALLAKTLPHLQAALPTSDEEERAQEAASSEQDSSPEHPATPLLGSPAVHGQGKAAEALSSVGATRTDALLQRLSALREEDRLMVVEALKAYRAHEAAAAAATARAAEYALDKKSIEVRFNNFRMQYLAVWLLCNVLLVTVVLVYELRGVFALGIAGAIFGAAGFRVLGSLAFRLQIIIRWIERRLCRSACRPCYRRHARTGKLVGCCRNPSAVFADDERWLTAHDISTDPRPFLPKRPPPEGVQSTGSQTSDPPEVSGPQPQPVPLPPSASKRLAAMVAQAGAAEEVKWRMSTPQALSPAEEAFDSDNGYASDASMLYDSSDDELADSVVFPMPGAQPAQPMWSKTPASAAGRSSTLRRRGSGFSPGGTATARGRWRRLTSTVPTSGTGPAWHVLTPVASQAGVGVEAEGGASVRRPSIIVRDHSRAASAQEDASLADLLFPTSLSSSRSRSLRPSESTPALPLAGSAVGTPLASPERRRRITVQVAGDVVAERPGSVEHGMGDAAGISSSHSVNGKGEAGALPAEAPAMEPPLATSSSHRRDRVAEIVSQYGGDVMNSAGAVRESSQSSGGEGSSTGLPPLHSDTLAGARRGSQAGRSVFSDGHSVGGGFGIVSHGGRGSWVQGGPRRTLLKATSADYTSVAARRAYLADTGDRMPTLRHLARRMSRTPTSGAASPAVQQPGAHLPGMVYDGSGHDSDS